MNKKRLLPDDRKQQILNAAIKVVGRPGGWSKLTREAVAREAECADALVSKYFGTMLTFRRTIMRAAIIRADLSVIAQGIAAGDKYAQKADADLKARALATLAA
jgi:hypothetical protein